MYFNNNNLSKSARRKLKRYGKIPERLRALSEKARFSQKELRILRINLQSGSQEHLWRRGEEMAALYNLKNIK